MKRLTLILLAGYLTVLGGEDLPNPDTSGLPPRTVAEQIPPRPIPEWMQTHLRVGHLPGSPRWRRSF
jgi:hypothetical protein